MRFVVLFVATLLPGSAMAQTAAEKLACEADFKRFCEGVQPGDNRVVECLSQHIDSLSAGCRKVVESHMPK